MVEVTVNGFQDKVIKGVVIFLLALSFETLTLEEGNCHAVRTLSAVPYAYALCPVETSMFLETEASSQQPCSEPYWKLILQPKANLQTVEVLTDIWTANSQEVLSQDYLIRLLPNS